MKRLALAVTLLAAPMAAQAAPLGPFSDFLVFGDSLSDPGNAFKATGGAFPPLAYYPDRQFTNGDTWATLLGADMASGRNFAFGGARAVTDPADGIPDLGEQLDDFALSGLVPGAGSLAAVWFGGNDMRDALTAADPASAAPLAIAGAVTAIATGVQALIGAGLGTVAVLGLPDLGKIPEVLAMGQAASTAATGVTLAFNSALATTLAGIAGATGADLRYVDIFGLFQAVQTNPAVYGFDTLQTPCLSDLLGGATADCQGYLFYDAIHPTQAAHALIADRFLATVAPVPLPAGLPLLAAGLAALGLLRRQRAF